MATDWDKEELQNAVEQGLLPLKESVDAVATEVFGLRECIRNGDLPADLDEKIARAYRAVGHCNRLLDERMKSFEKRLFSGIDQRLKDKKRIVGGDMFDLRRFLPYVVTISKRTANAPSYRGKRLQWAIVVCDREYNLLFASWLERKPTGTQVAAFASRDVRTKWGDEGGTNYLYTDASTPSQSDANWQAYSQRLRALSRLKCLHSKNWGSETPKDYENALDRWI